MSGAPGATFARPRLTFVVDSGRTQGRAGAGLVLGARLFVRRCYYRRVAWGID